MFLLHLFVILHNYHLFISGGYANQELVQQLCSPEKKAVEPGWKLSVGKSMISALARQG